MYMAEWTWFVYIIECLDRTYYTGMTWNIQKRFEQHISGMGGVYTKEHGVKKLAYVERHTDLEQARQRERQIKDWNQTKKQKLIDGSWNKDWE